jgi:hypothetical protein
MVQKLEILENYSNYVRKKPQWSPFKQIMSIITLTSLIPLVGGCNCFTMSCTVILNTIYVFKNNP